MSDGLGGWDQPAEAVGWQAPPLLLSGPWHACTPPRICPWPDFPAAPDHWHSFPQKSPQCPALSRSTHRIHQLPIRAVPPVEQRPQASVMPWTDTWNVTVSCPTEQRVTAGAWQACLFSPRSCGLGTVAPPSYR